MLPVAAPASTFGGKGDCWAKKNENAREPQNDNFCVQIVKFCLCLCVCVGGGGGWNSGGSKFTMPCCGAATDCFILSLGVATKIAPNFYNIRYEGVALNAKFAVFLLLNFNKAIYEWI